MCELSELLKNCPKNGIGNVFVMRPDNGAADITNLEIEKIENIQ